MVGDVSFQGRIVFFYIGMMSKRCMQLPWLMVHRRDLYLPMGCTLSLRFCSYFVCSRLSWNGFVAHTHVYINKQHKNLQCPFMSYHDFVIPSIPCCTQHVQIHKWSHMYVTASIYIYLWWTVNVPYDQDVNCNEVAHGSINTGPGQVSLVQGGLPQF